MSGDAPSAAGAPQEAGIGKEDQPLVMLLTSAGRRVGLLQCD